MLLRTYPLITHPAFLRHVENAQRGEPVHADIAPALVPSHCPRIKTPYDLSEYLGVSPLMVRSFVAKKEKHYRSFSVQKRSGGLREIDAPRTFLKVAQWWVLDTVLNCKESLPFVYGFSRGRSFIDNARAHFGARHLLNVDVRDFFPSINRIVVVSVFRELGYDAIVANFLAEICTLDGKLPQGAPTSPAISNMVMRGVDLHLRSVAEAMGCTYTRYADDLTFSSQGRIPNDFVGIVQAALSELGLSLNDAKTHFMGSNQVKEVTGLVLAEESVALSRRYLNGTRGWFHSITQIPEFYGKEAKRVEGTLTLLRQVGGRGTPRLINEGEAALAALKAVAPPAIGW